MTVTPNLDLVTADALKSLDFDQLLSGVKERECLAYDSELSQLARDVDQWSPVQLECIRFVGALLMMGMLSHERISRASSFGLVDVSAQPVAGCTLADFDPLVRVRLRQAVQQYGGDRVLLELDDEAMVGVLDLTQRRANCHARSRQNDLLCGAEATRAPDDSDHLRMICG